MAFTEEEINAALDRQEHTAQDEKLDDFVRSFSAACRLLNVELVDFADPSTLAGGVEFFLRMEYDEKFISSGIRGLLRPDPFSGRPKALMAALGSGLTWTPSEDAELSRDPYVAMIAGAYAQSLQSVPVERRKNGILREMIERLFSRS